MELLIEFEQEDDGRWIAEVTNMPGVLVYGSDKDHAMIQVKALALRALADQIEQGEYTVPLDHIAFLAT